MKNGFNEENDERNGLSYSSESDLQNIYKKTGAKSVSKW